MAFSDARAAVSTIPVVAANAPGVQRRSTAEAISAFGQLGGDARKGLLKRDLQTELEESSVIFDTLNARETVLTEDGVDISQSDPAGIIDQTSAKFQRLAKAREQGLLTENQSAIEGEVLLRQAVARAPGFEPEFRKLAADAVGFDVTGAATNTLFGNARVGTGPKTDLQKMQQKAEAFAAIIPNLSSDMALQVIAKTEFGALQKQADDQMLAKNRIASTQYGQTSAANFETDAMAEMALAEDASGEIQEPEAFDVKIREIHQTYMNRAFRNTNRNGIIDINGREDIRKILQASLDGVLLISKSKNARTLLSARADAAVDAIVLKSRTMFPGFALVTETVGEREFGTMLTYMAIAKNDPSVKAQFRKQFPGFDAALTIMESIIVDQIPQTVVDIYTDAGGDVPAARKDAVIATSQINAEISFNENDSKGVSAGIGKQIDLGLVKMPLSQVSKRPGGYNLLNNDRKQNVLNTYQTSVLQTQADLIRHLKPAGLTLNFQETREVFTGDGFQTAVRPSFELFQDGLSAKLSQPSFFGGEGGSPEGSDDLIYLNEVLLRMQQNNPQFMKDAGITDTRVWALAIQANVNDALITLPTQVPLQGPDGQELTRQEPGFFSDSQGNFFKAGENGEFTQIGGQIQRTLIPARLPMPKFSAGNTKIANQIAEASEERGVDPRIMVAIALVESRLNPNAANNPDNPGVADKEKGFTSALGLFQNTVDNFTDFGREGGDRTNPADSIEAGLNFWEFLQEKFPNDLENQLVHWHGGQNKRTIDQKDVDFADLVMKRLGL